MRSERTALLRHVWESPLSDFYRRHHGEAARSIELPLSSETDWLRIPPVTREDIGKTGFWQRLYTPPQDVHVIRPTSGTSGRSIALSPRANPVPVLRDIAAHGIEVSGALLFMNPPHMFEDSLPHAVPLVGGDPMHPGLSVAMARRLSVNVLVCYPYLMPRLEPFLEQEDFAARFRCVYLFGEYVPTPMRERYARLFPNALFINTYGASEVYGEVANVSYTSQTHRHIGAYRPRKSEYFLEILADDSATTEPRPGMEGELIITTLGEAARSFPMIRYRTGDSVRVVSCDAPGCFTFEMLGRSALDKLKLVGGVLWPREAEQALSAVFGTAFSGEYALEHAFQMRSGKEHCIVHLPKDLLSTIADLEAAARALAEALKVTPVRSYADGIRDGLYGELTFAELQKTTGKVRRILKKDA